MQIAARLVSGEVRGWPLGHGPRSHDRRGLAFYCAFSLAPLLIILVTLTGWIVGVETAQRQLENSSGTVRPGDGGCPHDRDGQSSQTDDGMLPRRLSAS